VLNTLTEHNFISFHLKTAKALVMVHRHGKWLLRGWWWPVSPKFVHD
jgi:hypothetical protein